MTADLAGKPLTCGEVGPANKPNVPTTLAGVDIRGLAVVSREVEPGVPQVVDAADREPAIGLRKVAPGIAGPAHVGAGVDQLRVVQADVVDSVVVTHEKPLPSVQDSTSHPDPHQAIDALEREILDSCRLVDMPLVHRFVPGMYIREIFMPAGIWVTSKIHNTEHPYVVTKGRVSVYSPEGGVQHIEAPYVGITQPGTRRVLFIHEDTTWLTFHPLVGDEGANGEADLPRIEERIIEKRLQADGTHHFDLYQERLREQALGESKSKGVLA